MCTTNKHRTLHKNIKGNKQLKIDSRPSRANFADSQASQPAARRDIHPPAWHCFSLSFLPSRGGEVVESSIGRGIRVGIRRCETLSKTSDRFSTLAQELNRSGQRGRPIAVNSGEEVVMRMASEDTACAWRSNLRARPHCELDHAPHRRRTDLSASTDEPTTHRHAPMRTSSSASLIGVAESADQLCSFHRLLVRHSRRESTRVDSGRVVVWNSSSHIDHSTSQRIASHTV
jgi:hypothetical protein